MEVYCKFEFYDNTFYAKVQAESAFKVGSYIWGPPPNSLAGLIHRDSAVPVEIEKIGVLCPSWGGGGMLVRFDRSLIAQLELLLPAPSGL